jgi:hypothetical protein
VLKADQRGAEQGLTSQTRNCALSDWQIVICDVDADPNGARLHVMELH